MKTRPFVIPVFIPHTACPHRCVFCDQSTITGHNRGPLSLQALGETIAEFLPFKGRHRGPAEVGFYGGNFLGLPLQRRLSLLGKAQEFVDQGKVHNIRFSTRPDSITHDALRSIAPFSVRTIEVGAQSMDDRVLSFSRRGHTSEDTEKAVTLLKAHGYKVGAQIMPGLPGSTEASVLETGRRVAALQPDFVRIYPTLVVRGTVLESWYRSGRYRPLSLSEAIEMCKGLLPIFKGRGISVARLGLQPSQSLLMPGVVVAGPFHPSFGHLVHSAVFLDLALRKLEDLKGPFKRVKFRVHPKDVSKIKGLRKENVTRLVREFELERLEILSDPTVPQGVLRV